MLDHITVHGARQHNLKNIDVRIPRNTFTVITGLSGSGKSSLAFDTIYAEGQRRYVETLSPYARQFLDQMERPEVDSIDGLSPAISIEQKTTSRSPRSTVGTITEIYDYLRLLYSSIGVPHCPTCGTEISSQSTDQILQQVMTLRPDDRVMILAPVAILSFQLGASSGNSQLTTYGIACVLGALFGLGLVLWSIRIPIDRTLPMPGFVRWSFIAFIGALLLVSTRLILKVPNSIPWKITPELSVVIGWMPSSSDSTTTTTPGVMAEVGWAGTVCGAAGMRAVG